MDAVQEKKCPDCGGSMIPIRVLQRQYSAFSVLTDRHRALEWAYVDSARGFLTEKYKVEGTVAALACRSCRRVFLYAEQSER